MAEDPTKRGLDAHRVAQKSLEVDYLEEKFPKLSRVLISNVIKHKGPTRRNVEAELEKLSNEVGKT